MPARRRKRRSKRRVCYFAPAVIRYPHVGSFWVILKRNVTPGLGSNFSCVSRLGPRSRSSASPRPSGCPRRAGCRTLWSGIWMNRAPGRSRRLCPMPSLNRSPLQSHVQTLGLKLDSRRSLPVLVFTNSFYKRVLWNLIMNLKIRLRRDSPQSQERDLQVSGWLPSTVLVSSCE